MFLNTRCITEARVMEKVVLLMLYDTKYGAFSIKVFYIVYRW